MFPVAACRPKGTARAWTPEALGSANLLAYVRAGYGMSQDTAETTPAAAGDDPVGYWRDLSGNAKHFQYSGSTSKRPLLKVNEINGRPALLFSGSNCLLSSANVSLGLFLFWMVGKRVGTTGIVYEHGPNVNTNPGSAVYLDNTTFLAVKRSTTGSSYATSPSANQISSSGYGYYVQAFGGTGRHVDHVFYKTSLAAPYTTNITGGGIGTGDPGTGSASDVIYVGQRGNTTAGGNLYVAEMGWANAAAVNLSMLGVYFAKTYGL